MPTHTARHVPTPSLPFIGALSVRYLDSIHCFLASTVVVFDGAVGIPYSSSRMLVVIAISPSFASRFSLLSAHIIGRWSSADLFGLSRRRFVIFHDYYKHHSNGRVRQTPRGGGGNPKLVRVKGSSFQAQLNIYAHISQAIHNSNSKRPFLAILRTNHSLADVPSTSISPSTFIVY